MNKCFIYLLCIALCFSWSYQILVSCLLSFLCIINSAPNPDSISHHTHQATDDFYHQLIINFCLLKEILCFVLWTDCCLGPLHTLLTVIVSVSFALFWVESPLFGSVVSSYYLILRKHILYQVSKKGVCGA